MLQCPHKIPSRGKWLESSHLPLTLLVGAQLHVLCQGYRLAVGKVEAALIHLGRTVRAAVHCGPALGPMQGKETQTLPRDGLQMRVAHRSQVSGPDWLSHRSWLSASLGCPRVFLPCCLAGIVSVLVNFKPDSSHCMTPPAESSLPPGAGSWDLDLLSPLSLLYQPQSFLGQPSQDVVACDAVPPSQDSPQLLGGFLGEEPQLLRAGHPPVLNHRESILLHSLDFTPCVVL